MVWKYRFITETPERYQITRGEITCMWENTTVYGFAGRRHIMISVLARDMLYVEQAADICFHSKITTAIGKDREDGERKN